MIKYALHCRNSSCLLILLEVIIEMKRISMLGSILGPIIIDILVSVSMLLGLKEP
jgi:uncharacterized membrane protein